VTDPSELAPVDPDAILRQPFSTVRKGYDPLEVQKYLMALAGELRAGRERERALERQVSESTKRAHELEHLSPQQLTSMLGEETAKVIEAANSASREIRSKAEESVARLLRDAQEQAIATRREADEVLEHAIAEAERITTKARDEVDDMLQQARIDADADAEAGRQRGREMVTEAQRVRERTLRDLARRRKTLRQQIEQLNAGRERLVEAYAVVRETFEIATNELDIVLPEAKVAADLALQRAIEQDDIPLEVDMAILSAEIDGTAPPVIEPGVNPVALATGSTPGSPAVDEPASDEVAAELAVAEPEVGADGDLELVEEGGPDDDYEEPRAPDPIAGRHSSAVNVIVPSLADEELEFDEPSAVVEEPADAEPEPDELASSSARVAHLFARIRHEADAGEVHGEAAARLIPTDVPPGSEAEAGRVDEGSGDDLPLDERCARILRELERNLARHVKRELSDEQNEMLDAVRREPDQLDASVLLADPEDHVARYADAASASLSDAVLAGGELVPPAARAEPERGRVGSVARDLAADLAAEIVAPLRVRVEQSFATVAAANGADAADELDLSETIRSDYREWRTQRVDSLVTRAVATALNQGVLIATAPTETLRWLVVTGDDACEPCRGNGETAGSPAEQPFPSGHLAPPLHDGCRCVLVVDRA
jgi:cell division septum initiation protein DivIVA